MQGDGLALAILIGMILIVGAGLLVGVLLSRLLARRFGWSGSKRLWASLGLGALGIGAGALAVIATFFESTWAPPPLVALNAPQGFTHSWVIVLQDPATPNALSWQGVEMPFRGKSTAIDVPPSGIVRVRDLGGLRGRADITVRWNDGASNTGQAGGPAPKSTGATAFGAFNRVKGEGAAQDEPPFGDDAALGAYIAARERAAR
jgi:hypothetical protein